MTIQSTRPVVWQISAALGLVALLLATVLLAVSSSLLAAAVPAAVLVLATPLLAYLMLTARAPQRAPRRALPTPLEPRQISTASGEVLQGWTVPLEHTDSYQLVLTTQGYRMVNADGQVVHRFE